MDGDNEEYQCSVSLYTVFDPVNINPTPFLYDRNSVETLLENNPRRTLPTIPQTRRPFIPTDVTPNVALRVEMRQYFQEIKGTEYTGWEVIPDYPQRLYLPAMKELLAQILHSFSSEAENLPEMSEENWSNARKRLNYLRLNLQLEPLNRQLFLSDEKCIKVLGEIISKSYSRALKSEEITLFHRESLRMIRVLDMSTRQLSNQLQPQDASQCSRFIQFLIRNLQFTSHECFHSLVLRILSIESSLLKPEEVCCVLEYVMKVNPTALSSTDMKNIANILHRFCAANFLEGGIQLLLVMITLLVPGLVQMFTYLLGFFKSADRLGTAEDALQALWVVLFLIAQILHCPQVVQQPALASSVDMNLLTNVEDMIRMEVAEDRSPVFDNLSEEHWLFLLSIAVILYEATGTVATMRKENYGRYAEFLLRPISVKSEPVKALVEKILQGFKEVTGDHYKVPDFSDLSI